MMELERIIRKRLDAALSALDSAYVALNGIPSNLDPDSVGLRVGWAINDCDRVLLELKNLHNREYEVPAEDGWVFDR